LATNLAKFRRTFKAPCVGQINDEIAV